MYNYKFENGHCIVQIEDGKWMIDTGAPSFSFDNNITNVEIEGVMYKLSYNPSFKSVVEKTVGISITGIIGCDILSKTSFSMDVKGNFYFGLDCISKDNYINVEIKSYISMLKNNVIIGNVIINDINVKVLFDTGAHINYIDFNLIKNSQFQNQNYELIDYDFNNNVIISKKILTVVTLGEEIYKIWFGIPKEASSSPITTMSNLNCNAIIGLYNLNFNSPIFRKYFGIDYNNKKMYIK